MMTSNIPLTPRTGNIYLTKIKLNFLIWLMYQEMFSKLIDLIEN